MADLYNHCPVLTQIFEDTLPGYSESENTLLKSIEIKNDKKKVKKPKKKKHLKDNKDSI